MIKYIDSFRDVEALTTSGTTTYSAWYDISWGNEIYSWLGAAETGTSGSESTVVTLQRETKGAYANQTVLTHGTVTAAATEEKYGRSWGSTDSTNLAADNILGTRVRWKYVTSGTWYNTVTFTMDLLAVRR